MEDEAPRVDSDDRAEPTPEPGSHVHSTEPSTRDERDGSESDDPEPAVSEDGHSSVGPNGVRSTEHREISDTESGVGGPDFVEVVAMTEDRRDISPDDVCILIPTLDEAPTIGDVIEGFHEQGYTQILVVDGGSTDGTADAARKAGAQVITQSGTGKGQAVREAMEYVDLPYILMVDGDGTYDPADAEVMLDPLSRGYEHVIGNRFADMDDDAMRRLNGFGNRMINGAFRVIHGAAYEDILSGYRAFTRESFDRLPLDADGFTIETELAVECAKEGVDTTVVPISYRSRPEESETNLHPVWDGGTIIITLYTLAKTNNPLFYFGSLGVAGILSGSGIAAYVLYRYLLVGVSHEILAVVSAAAILLGVQLLMFGVLSDMIVTLHREQRRRLERITRHSDQQSGRAESGGAHDDEKDD